MKAFGTLFSAASNTSERTSESLQASSHPYRRQRTPSRNSKPINPSTRPFTKPAMAIFLALLSARAPMIHCRGADFDRVRDPQPKKTGTGKETFWLWHDFFRKSTPMKPRGLDAWRRTWNTRSGRNRSPWHGTGRSMEKSGALPEKRLVRIENHILPLENLPGSSFRPDLFPLTPALSHQARGRMRRWSER